LQRRSLEAAGISVAEEGRRGGRQAAARAIDRSRRRRAVTHEAVPFECGSAVPARASVSAQIAWRLYGVALPFVDTSDS
jgi:hypothetical protein